MTNKTNTNAIEFSTVKKALETIDSRFVVFDDITVNENADRVINYCSLRLVLKDKSIDTRKIFCIYYNKNSVTIHCAKRFESVCDTMYKINSKKTEYTLTCKLEDLQTNVHALLAYECSRLKMSTYVRNEKTTVNKRSKSEKKAN